MMKGTLRQLDAYAKTLDDFRVRTNTGGIVTLVSYLVIAVLLVSEWISYITPEMHEQIVVDSSRKQEMDIYINITYPKIPCALLSLDAMDVSGEHRNELTTHDIYKVRIDEFGRVVDDVPEKHVPGGTLKEKDLQKNSKGKTCGSCYGADPPAGAGGCCNTCKDIQDAYARKGWSFVGAETMEQCVREGYVEKIKQQEREGCNIYGKMTVNKVAGNFHFAPGKSVDRDSAHIHDMNAIINRQFDFSHRIHYLSFGPVVKGMRNPMDGMVNTIESTHSHLVQYFIKVVGARYHWTNGSDVYTNQFSVTEHRKDVSGPGGMGHVSLPGVFFDFDISPMVIVHRETTKSFFYFLISACAVVGGVFTVAGMVDSALYRTARVFQQKMDLGKMS